MIETDFDIPFVAEMAWHEKQIQQNYRPIIAVHKWFARRPGTLFRSLILSEFANGSLRERYFDANSLQGIRIADPFMGGGTPLLEANRLGCDVIGYDINPMAYWIVREEIEHIDLSAYREAANRLVDWLERKVGTFYRTRCLKCGSQGAHVKYFLWVKVKVCRVCGKEFDLFPGYLVAEDRRHPRNVVVCSECGALVETESLKNLGRCPRCGVCLALSGPARRNFCRCRHCGAMNRYPSPEAGPPKHRMFAIEYFCPQCKQGHRGRFFKEPDKDDAAKYAAAEQAREGITPTFVPNEAIPRGDETDRLHRWGYRRYEEMFNSRQLLGLEMSCQAIAQVDDERLKRALATNLSDLLRYQNMLCRYDTKALKSLDIFSVHGFPVGLVQCESNLLGIVDQSQGMSVGSGGWRNIIEKYTKAKAYCENPFEVRHEGARKIRVPIRGEWIGDQRKLADAQAARSVILRCKSATLAEDPANSLDAVVTDPPYYGNVQYAELMDFCYVWLRRLAEGTIEAFWQTSTRNELELTGNATMDRGMSHFTDGLSEAFCRMTKALKPGRPFVFTYHHNTIEAYLPVAVAILDAGLTCSASLPCPAEMGASIHINGTGSSIIDTVFVCRTTGRVPRRWIAHSPEDLASLVRSEIEDLRSGNVTLTRGDIRCMIFGHLIRMAIWRLRSSWDRGKRTEQRLQLVATDIQDHGGCAAVERQLESGLCSVPALRLAAVREGQAGYSEGEHEVLF